jgi:hypothetical protein
LLSVVAEPTHTLKIPVMSDGKGFTVKASIEGLHDAVVYDIVVVPAATPVSIPAVSTVAIAGSPLVHTPPGTAFPSAKVLLSQITAGPVIEVPAVFTVTTLVL